MKVRHAFWLLSLLGLGCAPQEKEAASSCEAFRCASGATVDFTPGFLSPGSYSFKVETNEGTTTCQAKVPDDIPASALPCQASGVRLTLGPHDSIGNGPSITGIVFDSTELDYAHITVERDGQKVHDGSVTLKYQDHELNGDACGTTCSTASTGDYTLAN